MAIICCVTPAEGYLEETRSTLQFAQRAKMIKTHAMVNEVLSALQICALLIINCKLNHDAGSR
jgi:hypothetical protein